MATSDLRISAQMCPIRESMRRLPRWMQPFLTWLTCKPLAGESFPRTSPMSHLVKAVACIVGGVLVAVAFSPWGLVPGWVLTVHGARTLQLLILHQCAHDNFTGNARRDSFVGGLISMALLIENYEVYKVQHLELHHSHRHMSVEDPTVKFLFATVGLRPGMPKIAIWVRVALTLISPLYHLQTCLERLHSQCITPHPFRLIAWIFWAALLTLIVSTHQTSTFLLVWGIPLGLLYNISSCLRLCSEHRWSEAATDDTASMRTRIVEHSHGIFLGSPAPHAGGPFLRQLWAWSQWIGVMIGCHVPVRLLVLVGDTPCHDFHHRRPRSKQWTTYAHARQYEIESNRQGWPHYTEVWGFWRALDTSFASLSQLHGSAHVAA